MPASLYAPLFLLITTIMAFSSGFIYLGSKGYTLQIEKNNFISPLIISLIFVFWLGNRPISGAYFGDTANYAASYALMGRERAFHFDLNSEWTWFYLMLTSKKLGLDIHAFFTIIEAGYILSVLWAVKRFMPTNPMLGMLFVFTSLMFFTFGTNGLRNGLACNIILLAMSFFFDDKYIVGALLCLIAFGIHRSTMLPIVGMFGGFFLLTNLKWAIYFWFFSILLSLAMGGSIINFFASLGFDDRMASYNTLEYADQFSHTGFRWDFLLYSAMPIIMGWYVCIKKQIRDDWYKALCITYTLCNAFWVMVIRAAFSNRFAYLSWFMYPIIIAYPLINLPIWKDQDKKTGIILLVYSSFNLFMWTLYW
ncbi:MAG: EpsG family protein [Erysipelotrichales bacterium]|nr:EpsG family protein [Erysipelotrichales bacterium]